MKAIHTWKNLSIEKEVDDSTGFLLTNKNSGYCSFSFPNISRYNGFFIFEDDKMFKILDSINIKDSGKAKQINNYFYHVDVGFEKAKQSIFLPSGTNSMVVEFDSEKDAELLFDIKRSYDNDDKEKNYEIDIKRGKVVIRYTKKKKGIVDYEVFVVIRAFGDFDRIEEFVKKDYSLDKKRNSPPFERNVFKALRIKSKKFIITAGLDKKKAERDASRLFSSADRLFEKDKKLAERFKFPTKVPLNIAFSYLSCYNNLVGSINKDSFFAGLPWFFQNWTRDSAVSVKALIDLDEYKLAKNMLFNLFSLLDYDGSLKSRVGDTKGEGLKAADALGWVCLRFNQLITKLKKKNLLSKYFTKKELDELTYKIEHSIFLITKFKTKDGLAVNDELETWMDTKYDKDTRPGARIEIQALRLALFRFAYELTKKKEFKKYEEELNDLAYKKFWNRKYLDDGLDDFTVRPNVFLAAYAYPDLLEKEKWIECFKYIVPELWLDWGGFSSIERCNMYFVDEYTGENNRSYHRGDSWFWVNNYAAIALNKLGDSKLKKLAEKIVEASSEEILWKGMIGCHTELSSAKEPRSEGCWSQTWSNASFIELVNELYL